MIYFDNAATSWPKPAAVRESAVGYFHRYGANPGRSGHTMAMDTAAQLYRCREEAAALFSVEDPCRVIFTPGCTFSLNQILFGLLRPGEHLLISDLEHNSVLRPALYLREHRGVQLDVVTTNPADTERTVEAFAQAIRPNTRLILVTHCSNVFGFSLPIGRLAKLAHDRGILFGVDAAQSAGAFPLPVDRLGIDYLAAAGHKGLYGPTGTGLLILGKNAPGLTSLVHGGTGTFSREPFQPNELPEGLESGTLNTFGLLGLLGGLSFVRRVTPEQIGRRERELIRAMYRGLTRIPGVTVYASPETIAEGGAVLSFRLAGQTGEDTAWRLAKLGFGLRGGLHCAPLAHSKMGTLEGGTVRASVGYFNTGEQVEQLCAAVESLR